MNRNGPADGALIRWGTRLPQALSPSQIKLKGLGLQVETAEHAWVHWRSLDVSDPEGNQVELVCYDASVGA
jgi:hypothetical protein